MRGWGLTGLVIAGYDLFAILRGHETLSGSWWRWLDDPRGRVLCAVVWGAITLHLFAIRWPSPRGPFRSGDILRPPAVHGS